MQSYGAVNSDGEKSGFATPGYPADSAPPYPPAGYQQHGGPAAAAQGGFSPPPYPPASATPGGTGGPDNYQLPPDVKIDSLPMSSDGDSSLPTAPPMDAIHGYGQFDNTPLAPPSYDDATRQQEPPNRPALNQAPVISEAQARAALLEHCAQHCCYGKGAAEDMVITTMTSSSAYHYVLETFGESRSTAWTSTPYSGGPVDSPMNGPAPMPWDIPVSAPEKFKTIRKLLEVPHTANIKPCHKCFGMGRLRCHHCCGSGHTHCTSCSGGYVTFNNERRPCSSCHGTCRQRCTWCHGHGHICCTVCHGHRQLKWYIQLTVQWTNHVDDYILERTAMPDSYIRKVEGQTVFEEELPWVYPVTQCPEPSVNKASSDLVKKHHTSFPSERLLLQRHKVRVVPVTEVHANWKNKSFVFYVHGLEHAVYSKDYPQQCCCGCTLI